MARADSSILVATCRDANTFASSPACLRMRVFSSSSGKISSAVVTQRVFPSKTGDDQPRPGSSVFHFRESFSPKVTGTFSAVETPSPLGPRNWGQGAAERVVEQAAMSVTTRFAFMKTNGLQI